MPIYEQPTKTLMAEWARTHLQPNQIFKKVQPARWFAEKYPKIKSNTVMMHVEGMAVNNHVRKHHANVRPGSGHDLFWKLGPDQFRLWNSDSDPAPLYKPDFEKGSQENQTTASENEAIEAAQEAVAQEAASEFAFERDLRNYLVKNLSSVEPGLRLYEEEELTGIEFPVGGRFIDILAVDKDGAFVVFELKVSRGYDRVIGQLLRYMSWVEQHMDTSRPVRGVIVASDVTEDLKLAASRIPDVRLIEYKISFSLHPVTLPSARRDFSKS